MTTRNDENLTASEATPVGYTLAPGVSSRISMKTAPNAICTLRRAHEKDGPALTLFANDEGMIHVHVKPTGEHHERVRFVVECDSDEGPKRFPLELRSNQQPTAEMPAPSPPASTGAEKRRLRPALAKEEALRMTDMDLLAKRYPPRPDAEKVPKAFETWLEVVTKPMQIVEPRLVANPDRRHRKQPTPQAGTESFANWSGVEVRGGNVYDVVSGQWLVPDVTGDPNQLGNKDYSTLWVGIDGDGKSDLVQAGTEQDVIAFPFPFGGFFQFTSFYAWTEFLPTQPTEQVISNYSINPGDLVWVTVIALSLPLFPVGNLTTGFFQFENLTTGQSTMPIAIAQTTVGATEAEWIMERPTLVPGNVLPELADYGSALMVFAYAKTKSGQTVLPSDPSNVKITMTNTAGTKVLSTAAAVGVAVDFTWKAFN